MKRIIYLSLGFFALFYLSKSLITSQSRHFKKEFIAKIENIDFKEQRINRKWVEVPFISVLDSNNKAHSIRINKSSLNQIKDSEFCIIVIEEDIFNNVLFELKEEYENRQINISTSSNKFWGICFIGLAVIGWIGWVYYFYKTTISILKNYNS